MDIFSLIGLVVFFLLIYTLWIRIKKFDSNIDEILNNEIEKQLNEDERGNNGKRIRKDGK